MKLMTATALLLAASTATAGGLAPPVSERPTARPVIGTPATVTNWAGGYAGASLGYQESTTTDELSMTGSEVIPCEPKKKQTKINGEWVYITEDCKPEVISYSFSEVITQAADDATYGGYLGYRHSLGGGVYAGGELAAITGNADPLLTAEATLSLGFGSALATASYGFASMGNEDGTSYGLGLDYLATSNMTVGVKAYRAEFDSADVEGIALRVGFLF